MKLHTVHVEFQVDAHDQLHARMIVDAEMQAMERVRELSPVLDAWATVELLGREAIGMAGFPRTVQYEGTTFYDHAPVRVPLCTPNGLYDLQQNQAGLHFYVHGSDLCMCGQQLWRQP